MFFPARARGGGLLKPLVDLLGHGGPAPHSHPCGHHSVNIGEQKVAEEDPQKDPAVAQKLVGGESASRESIQKQAQYKGGCGVVEPQRKNGGQEVPKDDPPELFQIRPHEASDGNIILLAELNRTVARNRNWGPQIEVPNSYFLLPIQ